MAPRKKADTPAQKTQTVKKSTRTPRAKKQVGRKTMLNKELLVEIEKLLASSAYEKPVYQALNISRSTWYHWKELGEAAYEAGKPDIYAEFLDTVERTQARGQIVLENVIRKAAANGDWKAALEILKRTNREDWSDNQKVDVNAKIESEGYVVLKYDESYWNDDELEED